MDSVEDWELETEFTIQDLIPADYRPKIWTQSLLNLKDLCDSSGEEHINQAKTGRQGDGWATS